MEAGDEKDRHTRRGTRLSMTHYGLYIKKKTKEQKQRSHTLMRVCVGYGVVWKKWGNVRTTTVCVCVCERGGKKGEG